ncbi:hypothetical protein SLEP1_g46673 [Rubroshorea leprosula]|uniref:Uncharacterized protein n=1 Tax=Rubroshorea leprosula TaxID=152421 RepID=A0AAV5LNQ4_9ROSI|nr:hypothetical protein SLEP1_g46673 [Rubroshorea leprosula]
MALFSNFSGCISESFGSKKRVCQGDVCVLRQPMKAGGKTLMKKWRQRV